MPTVLPLTFAEHADYTHEHFREWFLDSAVAVRLTRRFIGAMPDGLLDRLALDPAVSDPVRKFALNAKTWQAEAESAPGDPLGTAVRQLGSLTKERYAEMVAFANTLPGWEPPPIDPAVLGERLAALTALPLTATVRRAHALASRNAPGWFLVPGWRVALFMGTLCSGFFSAFATAMSWVFDLAYVLTKQESWVWAMMATAFTTAFLIQVRSAITVARERSDAISEDPRVQVVLEDVAIATWWNRHRSAVAVFGRRLAQKRIRPTAEQLTAAVEIADAHTRLSQGLRDLHVELHESPLGSVVPTALPSVATSGEAEREGRRLQQILGVVCRAVHGGSVLDLPPIGGRRAERLSDTLSVGTFALANWVLFPVKTFCSGLFTVVNLLRPGRTVGRGRVPGRQARPA